MSTKRVSLGFAIVVYNIYELNDLCSTKVVFASTAEVILTRLE